MASCSHNGARRPCVLCTCVEKACGPECAGVSCPLKGRTHVPCSFSHMSFHRPDHIYPFLLVLIKLLLVDSVVFHDFSLQGKSAAKNHQRLHALELFLEMEVIRMVGYGTASRKSPLFQANPIWLMPTHKTVMKNNLISASCHTDYGTRCRTYPIYPPNTMHTQGTSVVQKFLLSPVIEFP